MEIQQQYKLDALERSQEFLDTHEEEVGPLKDTEGRRQLDAAVAKVAAHRQGQLVAENERRAAKARQESAATELQTKHMKPIAKFARAKLPGVPDFASLSENGSRLRTRALVPAARAMAAAAESVVEVLVAAQFPADVVPQLTRAADTLEEALNDHATRKVAKGVATASLRQHLEEGRSAVALLDPIVTRKLAGNAGLLEGWRRAKRVVNKPGVVSGAVEVAAPAAPVAVPSVPVAPVLVVGPSATGAVTSSSTPSVEKAA